MRVRPDLCATRRSVQGGVLTAFSETLRAMATFMRLPQGARRTTISSKTNFLARAAEGATITGVCTAFHRGRMTMVWQTLVKSETGRSCAVVSQTRLVVPKPAVE